MPPRPGSWRRRLLLAAAALVFLLLLAEGALRVGAILLHRERGVAFDPVLGWRMLPGVEKWGEFWSATEPGRTNRHGWRDRERALPKPPGERRLAVLGDSFTFGQGVDVAARFTERLEQASGWQVLNFGCCAYGTDQQLLVFEHHAAAFAPDGVVLVVFLGNDLDDIRLDRQSGWAKPWFRLRAGELELVPPIADWTTTLRSHSHLGELALQAVERGTPAARRAMEWRDGDTLPLFVALVQRLHRATRERGAHLLVVLTQPCDSARRPLRHTRADDVLAALRGAGIDVVDTHAAFAAVRDDSLFLANGHWSAAGHARIGDCLHAALAERSWFTR